MAELVEAVQTNCDIADARHGSELSLCSYLLQMRELFLWEGGVAPGTAPDRDALAAWLSEREARWDALADAGLVTLPWHGRRFDAFDVDAVNEVLAPHRLLYGAGLAGPRQPIFFLADLQAAERREPVQLRVGGREHARGLFAPPAALHGGTVLLRRDALQRWLWQRYESWSLRRAAGAFRAALDACGFDGDPAPALQRMADEQLETLTLHELGEHRAGESLGPGWAAMRLTLHDRRTELHARAVRDHLADLRVTLPTLLEREAAASIHFWFAGYEGVREAMYPSLHVAYDDWRRGDGGRALRRAARQGDAHFSRLAGQALALHARDGDRAGSAIERLLTDPQAVCPA